VRALQLRSPLPTPQHPQLLRAAAFLQRHACLQLAAISQPLAAGSTAAAVLHSSGRPASHCALICKAPLALAQDLRTGDGDRLQGGCSATVAHNRNHHWWPALCEQPCAKVWPTVMAIVRPHTSCMMNGVTPFQRPPHASALLPGHHYLRWSRIVHKALMQRAFQVRIRCCLHDNCALVTIAPLLERQIRKSWSMYLRASRVQWISGVLQSRLKTLLVQGLRNVS
jgi:hypothetical protein